MLNQDSAESRVTQGTNDSRILGPCAEEVTTESDNPAREIRAVTRLKKRVAVLVMAAVVGLGATACMPDTGPPPVDPLQLSAFNAMNRARVYVGLPALTWSPRLVGSAGPHSNDMANANTLYHSDLNALIAGPDFQQFWTLGENVLVGPGRMTGEDVAAAWMKSAPHQANILSSNFNTVGVGWWYGPDGRLWVTAIYGGHN